MADKPEHQVLPSSPELQQKIKLLQQAKDLMAEMEDKQTAHYKKAIESKQDLIAELEKEERLLERQQERGKALDEDQKKHLLTLRDQIKFLKLKTEEEEKAVKSIQEHERALEELNKDGEAFANTLMGISGNMGAFTKKLFGTKGGLKAFGKGLAGLLNPFKLLISFMTKVIEASVMMAVNMDKARASFVKATGAARQFENEVVGLSYALRGTGIRADEVAQAYGSLYSGFVDFTKASNAQRASLTQTVAKFQELGVSAQLQAEIATEATRSLGYGFGQVEGVLRDVGGVAAGLNEPFDKVMQNFATVSKKLAFYGTNVMGVFKKLSKQAKATGLSMDELLGLVEQFDTFEGAGRAVGKLNAIMGGPYLNSIDMLNASEEERVEILQRSMKQAGKNFKDMGKYEQKMIAASMGVGVEQARKLFGGGETEQQKLERMKKARLDARVSRGQDIQEKMLSLVESMALNWMPWLEKIKNAVDIVAKHMRKLLDWFQDLGTVGKAKVLLGAIIGSYVISRLPKWLVSEGPKGARAQFGLGGAPGTKPPPGTYWNAKAGQWVDLKTSKFAGGAGKFGKPSMWQRATGAARRATGLTGRGFGGLKQQAALNKMIQKLKPPSWMNPAKWPRPQWLTKIIETALPAVKVGLGKLLVGLDAIFLVFDAWGNWTNKAQDNVDRIGKTVMSIVGAISLVVGSIVALPATIATTLGLAFGQVLQWGLKKAGLGFLVAEGELNPDTHGKNVFEQAWMAGRLATDWVTGKGGHDSGGGSIMFEGEKRSQSEVDAILKERGVDDFIYRGDETGGRITPINKKDEFLGMKANGTIQRSMRDMARANAEHTVDLLIGGKGKRGEPQVINVYVGKKKVDSIVIDAFDGPAGKKLFGPFARNGQ